MRSTRRCSRRVSAFCGRGSAGAGSSSSSRATLRFTSTASLAGRSDRGDFFGETSLLTGGTPTADVVATGLLRCAVVPGPEFEQFLLARPRFLYRLLQAEADRLRNALEWRQ